MKTFLDWVKDENLDLTVQTAATPAEPADVEQGEETSDENTKRAGISANYPDAYVRAQYPHKYFNPVTATADGKLAGKIGS